MASAVGNFSFDLSEYEAKINTALGAGRAEVRLNHSRETAKFRVKEFDQLIKEALQNAKTNKEVT